MKSFKELTEKYIFNYKNHKFISTNHSADRSLTRWNITNDQRNEFFKKIINKMYELGYENDEGQYLFFSKSLQLGLVTDYRKDNKSSDSNLHFVIITVLPKGKSTAKSGTTKIVTEQYKDENCKSHVSQDFLNYIDSLYSLHESKIENGNVEFDNLSFYFVDGKVWDCNFDIIDVDN